MNLIKRQALQNQIIDQAGLDRLILNDLILGPEGAAILAELIPQYHPHLQHIQIKGNNLDGQSFQTICYSLVNCTNIKSIMAEWNSIGLSPSGITALANIIPRLPHLQLIDLKNNRIGHQLADLIAEIILINSQSLKVLDFRWNQLGQIGGKIIFSALTHNPYIKFIGLEDNRITAYTMMQIEQLIRNEQRSSNKPISIPPPAPTYFPLSDNSYASMDLQIKASEIRSKIQNEQKQGQTYSQKVQIQIQKIVQKLTIRSKQIHESQIKLQSLGKQNLMLISQLRQAERISSLDKQRILGIQRNLNQQKSNLRKAKYEINTNIQIMMAKYTNLHQRELQQLEAMMSQKMERIQIILKDRLNQKRNCREKLADLKEDIVKIKMGKQLAWDKITTSAIANSNSSAKDHLIALEDLISEGSSTASNQLKKGNYMAQQLTNLILKGLNKQQKLEDNIHELKNRIKSVHNQMTQANIQIEGAYCKNQLLEAQAQNKESNVEMRRRYLRYIQSQNSINCDIQKLKGEQVSKAERLGEENIDKRILDLQLALRAQNSQNKMLKNQYQKLLSLVESASKATIHHVLFNHD